MSRFAVEITQERASHTAVALNEHFKALRRAGVQPSKGLVEWLDLMVDLARDARFGARTCENETALAGSRGDPHDPEQLLVDREGVARMLNIGVRNVHRLVVAGSLTPLRVGRSTRYRISDVKELING